MTIDSRDREMLEALQRDTFHYFIREADPHTGLIADTSGPGSASSITATGMGMSILCVAVERGWLSRAEAVEKILVTLRFLHESPQSDAPDATGYRGFYYHFLDMKSGRRAGGCELSTVDTSFLIAGVLTVSAYFDGADSLEREVRTLADALYRRVDWAWACNGAATIGHGWTPEAGFLESSWNCGYSEALLLYVLALGSPTFPIGEVGYARWTSTFEAKTFYGIEYLYAGPLFIHQLSHVWLDFRGIGDDRNRGFGCDYFENSRRATLVHQRYAIENPCGFSRYSKYAWGLTASEGPGPATRVVDGRARTFYGYLARGAPCGPDDGTLSPWAVVASLPFAPALVCETLHHAVAKLKLKDRDTPGFDASFNPTFRESDDVEETREPSAQRDGWVARWRLGLNEGPIVLMIENHTSGLLWRLLRSVPYVVAGLRSGGFRGGWLDGGE